MSTRAIQRVEEFGTLANGLVHEIRNRLNTIRLNLFNLQHALARPNTANVPSPLGPGEDRMGDETATLVQDMADEVDRPEPVLWEFLRLAQSKPPQPRPYPAGERRKERG